MISLQPIGKFFLTMILTFMLAITIAFDFGTAHSWAATMNRGSAFTKNVEGKVQETIGNITGDPQDQIMGKAKQVESQVRNAAEDVKDNLELQGRAKAVTKNIEGKAQEAMGNITGNRKDQVVGKAKQVESQARNAVEDVKDNVRGLLN